VFSGGLGAQEQAQETGAEARAQEAEEAPAQAEPTAGDQEGDDAAAEPKGKGKGQAAEDKQKANPKKRADQAKGQGGQGTGQGGKDKDPQPARKETRAQAFARELVDAFTLEVNAQNYERRTLGSEELERLSSYRLKRRLRIDTDKAEFQDRMTAVPLKAINIPMPLPSQRLGTKELVALSGLKRGYGSTRDVGDIRIFVSSNESFLRSGDWSDRDTAVRIRDRIMKKETEFLRLAGEARKILLNDLDAPSVEAMIESLIELAPEAMSGETDVTRLVLRDGDVREKVVLEAQAFLAEDLRVLPPETEASELLRQLPELQLSLVEKSGLKEVREELTAIEVELADVDARLEDRGVNSLTPDERKDKTRRRVELSNRQSVLQLQWMQTAPSEAELTELVETQDTIIRRRMHELGYRGALFAHRYDRLEASMAPSLEEPHSTWQLLEDQTGLIVALDEATPDPEPMAGLIPPMDPRLVAQQQQLILALKKTRPDLFRALPKPKKQPNIKLKVPKAKTLPKPRSSGGGGGRGGGRRRR